MLRLLHLLCGIVLFNPLFAQTSHDLIKQLEEANKHYLENNFETAENWADSLILFSQEDPTLLQEAYLLKARCQLNREQPGSALSSLKTAIQIAGENDIIFGHLETEIANIYRTEGSDSWALEHYSLALEKYRKGKFLKGEAEVLFKCGIIYREQKDYANATQNMTEAIGLYKTLNESIKVASAYEQLAFTYQQSDNNPEAYKAYTYAAELYQQLQLSGLELAVLDELIKLAMAQNQLTEAAELCATAAVLSEEVKSRAQAQAYLSQEASILNKNNRHADAIQIQKALVDELRDTQSNQIVPALISLGIYYQSAGRQTETLLALHEAERLANRSDDAALLFASHKAFSDFHFARGEYEKAFAYGQSSDSLSHILEVRALNSAHQANSSGVAEYAAMDQKNQTLNQLSESNNRMWFITLLSASLALALLLCLFVFLFLRLRKTNRMLEWKVYKRTRELLQLNTELNTHIYKSATALNTHSHRASQAMEDLKGENLNESARKYTNIIAKDLLLMEDLSHDMYEIVDFKKLQPKISQVDFHSIRRNIESQGIKSIGKMNLIWNIKDHAPFFSDNKMIESILGKTLLTALKRDGIRYDDFCKITIATDKHGAMLTIEDESKSDKPKTINSLHQQFNTKEGEQNLGLYLIGVAMDKIKAKITFDGHGTNQSKLTFHLPNLL